MAALLFQQALVDGVLDEAMTKPVGGFRQLAPFQQEVGGAELEHCG